MPNLVVIGGGAAGIFAAVNAARMHPQLQVVVLEKSNKLLAKVKISGGGRCNVTHNCDYISDMVKNYPRGTQFVKHTFKHFFTTDTINWFTERGVPIVAEEDGRMFPKANTSDAIIDCLLQEAKKYNVVLRTQVGVQRIESLETNFLIHTNTQETIKSDYVLIACGGFPKLDQFAFIEQLGHSIVAPVPSLFTFNIPNAAIIAMPGVVAQDAQVKIIGTSFQYQGPVLITHWGLSGPAVLALSAYAARYLHDEGYAYKVQVNWCATYHETSILQQIRTWRNELATQKLAVKNPVGLVQRLWEFILSHCAIDKEQTWNSLTAAQQNSLAKTICSYELHAFGKTTYKNEFVTAGGVALSEVNSKTCESKLIPNLYFAGEILDVDGRTGGFNFQHAWSSAYVVAKAIGEKLK
jgi:predicted Rossmann fold flavoprotein